MTAQQKIHNWKHLTKILEDVRLRGEGDTAKAIRLAEQLMPFFPTFSYTLNRIQRRMQAAA